MTVIGWVQILAFMILVLAATRPLGTYMKHVMEGEKTVLDFALAPIESLTYRLAGVDEKRDMKWTEYAFAMLAFSVVSTVFSYVILRFQGMLPFNPMGMSTANAPSYATAITADLAFNTAVSFGTNTNWQAYGGESTMSYLSQMLALAFHNWVSAAAGIAVAIALVRGFIRQSTEGTIGNFWKDLVRSILFILLPLCFISSLIMVSQGCIQNFDSYQTATTIEGAKQVIPGGPVASQESIKIIGTNGGGFFNANTAHPFEGPTAAMSFFQAFLILLIPAALTYTFGLMVKDVKQGWALYAAMAVLSLAGLLVFYGFETASTPALDNLHVISNRIMGDLGGNMEGKEVRFGHAETAIFGVATTNASCGATNCAHDSLLPLPGLVALVNMQVGELIFGGVGAGLYGMLVFAILTVFIAGLMVGRTPEYLGKKIEKKEVKMSMLFVLAAALSILGLTAVMAALKLPAGDYWNAAGATFNNVNNPGPHGFSELLYAASSATANNGSAFAGLNANTPFFNLTMGLAMLLGRFLMQAPVLAIAGSLSQKKYVPPTSGTFPTNGGIFVVLLISVIVIVGALTFFPGLTVGPLVEHILMKHGRLF